MKLKWLIKTPTSFGNSERYSLNVVLFQLLRCLCAQTLCHCSHCRTQITKKASICSFLKTTIFENKLFLFWKACAFMLHGAKIKLGRESQSSYIVVTLEHKCCRSWCCVTLSSVVCCVVWDCVIREEENIVHCLVQSKARSVLSSINHQTVSRRGCNRPPSKHFVWHTKIRASIELNTKSAH